MKVEEAEEHLKDYLLYGIAQEIFWADEAYALAEEIGKRTQALHAAGFGSLFGSLQVILSDRQTLSVTKMFDQPKRYPTRSIPATLAFLNIHADVWEVRERDALHRVLAQAGASSASVEQLSSAELTHKIVRHYEVERANLEPALIGLRQSRDKVITHNEAIDRSTLQSSTWGDALSLVKHAQDFVTTIGFAYLGLDLGYGSGDYYLGYNARHTARQLRRLLDAANLSE